MGRAPCCEKKGVKKGSWSPQEDEVLVDFIRSNGHDNWRALPKLAGLRRCGKSCRLRWLNYLRPDIKRGNFTKEEEETIIKLHQLHGNRWSVIASRLPGRTDNEIKNVWHTYIKKRVLKNPRDQGSGGGGNVSPVSSSDGTELRCKEPKINKEEEKEEQAWFPMMKDSLWWDSCDSLMEIEPSPLPEPSCADMGFWYDLFTAGTLPAGLPGF